MFPGDVQARHRLHGFWGDTVLVALSTTDNRKSLRWPPAGFFRNRPWRDQAGCFQHCPYGHRYTPVVCVHSVLKYGNSVLFVFWLLNVPATCKCISGTNLLRQFYVLPHWDRNCRPNFPSHPVIVYWHQANQSQHWPYNTRRLAGLPLECQFWSHWYDSTLEKSQRKWDSNPGSSTLEADALTTGPTRQSVTV